MFFSGVLLRFFVGNVTLQRANPILANSEIHRSCAVTFKDDLILALSLVLKMCKYFTT